MSLRIIINMRTTMISYTPARLTDRLPYRLLLVQFLPSFRTDTSQDMYTVHGVCMYVPIWDEQCPGGCQCISLAGLCVRAVNNKYAIFIAPVPWCLFRCGGGGCGRAGAGRPHPQGLRHVFMIEGSDMTVRNLIQTGTTCKN